MIRFIAAWVLFALPGCAGQPLIDADLDAAIAIADAYGRKSAADCYRAQKAHAALQVAGIISANEFARTLPSLLDCAR